MYSFSKEKNSLVISIDGEPTYSIAVKTLDYYIKGSYVEVTDGNRYYISINPSQVSGTTTAAQVKAAIDTALS